MTISAGAPFAGRSEPSQCYASSAAWTGSACCDRRHFRVRQGCAGTCAQHARQQPPTNALQQGSRLPIEPCLHPVFLLFCFILLAGPCVNNNPHIVFNIVYIFYLFYKILLNVYFFILLILFLVAPSRVLWLMPEAGVNP
jgi:hypothetical protein